MKKLYRIIFALCIFCLFCAFAWPPEKYEMPRTALDAATVEESLSGLKISFGSIANIGFIIMGIVISVSLIAAIFRRLFLIQINKFDPPRPRSRYGINREAYSEARERDIGGFFYHRQDRQLQEHKERREDRL